MIGWREIPLGEACELYQPQTISTAQLVDDGLYEVFGANGVIGRYHSYNHEEPQLLVTCRGATCGTVNKTSPKAWINGNAMVVRPKANDIDMSYLEHLLRGGVDLSASITGAAQPQITRQSLAPIKAKFPPLPEQRRIAAILDQADALRAKRRQALAQLDSLTLSIFIEMFGDPVTNPRGWAVKKLNEISSKILNGTTPNGGSQVYVSDGILFLRSQNVWKNSLLLDDVAYIDEDTHSSMMKSSLKNKDILITKTGRINTENSSLGRAALFTGRDNSANINGHVYLVRLNEGEVHRFVLFILTTDAYREYIRSVCVGGIDKRQINKEHLEEFPIISPPIDLKQRFAVYLESIEKQKIVCRTQLNELEHMFSSLQHRAFRGEL